MTLEKPIHTQSCVLRRYDVLPSELPLSCPMPRQKLWNAHPRVFLPIEKEKQVVCPYCSTEYFLVEKDS